MPAAGVTPLRYGKETFTIASLAFCLGAILPLAAEGAPDDALEHIGLTMWFVEGLGLGASMLNFFTVANHVRQLLKSHIASMLTTETNRANGNVAAAGVGGNNNKAGQDTSTTTTISVAARQRINELDAVVIRLTRIRTVLMIGGAGIVPLFTVVGWVPWLRARQAYWIPLFMVWVMFPSSLLFLSSRCHDLLVFDII
jgi:hypothetical protein